MRSSSFFTITTSLSIHRIRTGSLIDFVLMISIPASVNPTFEWPRMTYRFFLSPAALQEYSQAIKRKGSPLTNCFGFIDGTDRPICRPREKQRLVYDGHKLIHGLKFQSVALPNGLIGNLYGPVEGRHGIMLRC